MLERIEGQVENAEKVLAVDMVHCDGQPARVRLLYDFTDKRYRQHGDLRAGVVVLLGLEHDLEAVDARALEPRHGPADLRPAPQENPELKKARAEAAKKKAKK